MALVAVAVVVEWVTLLVGNWFFFSEAVAGGVGLLG